MNTNEINRIKKEIEMKSQFMHYLPSARPIYSDPVNYGKNEYYHFDEEQFSTDPDYMEQIMERMKDCNEENEIFNSLLVSVLNFLRK